MRIGIDATNVGGGGGVTHLLEILENFDYTYFKKDISKIIVFASDKVLSQIPEMEYIEKINFQQLNGGLLKRVIFQMTKFDAEIIKRCDLLFSVTGDYIGAFQPVVSMSRNMLLYERNIWKEIKQPKEILRFWLNFQKQKKCFKNSTGIIFISQYARNIITAKLDLKGKNISIIHHGVSPRFDCVPKTSRGIDEYSNTNPYNFLYVSTVHIYKHQWNVIQAIANLRQKGFPVSLTLIGGCIFKPAGKKMNDAILKCDPSGNFIHSLGNVAYEEIDKHYKKADGIIFASTCENMPNILIESMSSGRPIACSNKEPMPEFLKDNGYYFNSKDVNSIEIALSKLISSPVEADKMISDNLNEINNYSWKKTSEKTFKFLLTGSKLKI